MCSRSVPYQRLLDFYSPQRKMTKRTRMAICPRPIGSLAVEKVTRPTRPARVSDSELNNVDITVEISTCAQRALHQHFGRGNAIGV